jgi:hypothetical protein
MNKVIINNAVEILQKKIKSNELAMQILQLDKHKYELRRVADAHSKYICDEKIKLVVELNKELSKHMKDITTWREEYCQNLVSQLNELDTLDETKELYANIHKYDGITASLMAQRDALEATINTTELIQYKFNCGNSCANDM